MSVTSLEHVRRTAPPRADRRGRGATVALGGLLEHEMPVGALTTRRTGSQPRTASWF